MPCVTDITHHADHPIGYDTCGKVLLLQQLVKPQVQ